MAASVFARRRSLPASLGRALLMAIQGVGEGVRGIEYQDEAMRRFGPDWRERLARESQLHDLSIRGKEQDIERGERQVEADRLVDIGRRQGILKEGVQQGAVELGGEMGDADLLPLQRNLTPGEAQPAPPAVAIPEEVRGLFPELDDATLARMVRGSYQESKRPMKILEAQVRASLERDRQSGREHFEGVKQPNRVELARVRGEEARRTRATLPAGGVSPEERVGAREFAQAVQAVRARLSALRARKLGGSLSAEGEQQVDFEIDQVGRQLEGLLARQQSGRGAVRPAAPAAPAAPATIAEPQSLDEANALPDGTLFLLNGQLYRKQGANAELVQ